MQPSLASSEVGIHYLSLALFARRVIDGLIALIDDGLRKVDFLDEAISSLQELEVGYPASNAVQHYEQVQTVQGIGSREDREKIVREAEGIDDADFQSSWRKETLDVCYDRTLCRLLRVDYNSLPPEDMTKTKVYAYEVVMQLRKRN